MQLTKKKITIFAVIAGLLFAIFGVLYFVTKQDTGEEAEQVELVYWGVFDEPDYINPIIEKYEEENPNVTITYEQKDFDSYEDDLLNAFAEGNGPDIFTLQNTRIPRFQYIIAPLPESETAIIDDYFDVVEKDAVIDNQVYGLPYSVDSLALFYNERMLQDVGITNPPRNWEEFDDAVQKISSIDTSGNFIQSGTALGGSSSTINRPTDILAYFFLQQGSPIVDASADSVVLDEDALGLDGSTVEEPGLLGLTEYLQYSRPTESVYSWNESQNYSFDLFAQEKVAMIFNYSYSIPTIRANNPKQNFKIAPAPQPEGATNQVTLASYWLETVAQDSEHYEESWEFLAFATNTENVKLYSSLSNKPVSRRDLVNEQVNDAELGAFARQNLYATSWHQYDPVRMEEILDGLLKNILGRTSTTEEAYDEAVSQMQAVIDEGRSFRIENEERIQADEEARIKAEEEAQRAAEEEAKQ